MLFLAGRFVKNDYSAVHGNVKIALKPLVIPAAPSEILGEVSAMDVQNVPPGMYAIQYAARGKVLIRARVVIEQ